jgi:hypothetical protein
VSLPSLEGFELTKLGVARIKLRQIAVGASGSPRFVVAQNALQRSCAASLATLVLTQGLCDDLEYRRMVSASSLASSETL